MRNFLDSLRSDLLDRRFVPVLALLGVALIAALAFAVLGGGSSTSSTPPATSPATGASGPAGTVAITPAPAANEAVAETTSGAHQHSKAPRNPFTPLPSSKAKSATASTPAKSSSASSSSPSSGSSSSSSTSTGGSKPKTETTPKPAAPVKRVYIHYHVTAEFGLVPAVAEGAPPQPAQLKTYPNMSLDEPLPSKTNPQLVFLGVVLRTGKDAVFALTGAAILHGNGVCKPSPTQCQAIQLPVGQSETLEVVEANGQSATYELKLVSISKSVGSASAAKADAASAASSKAGRTLLHRAGLSALPRAHYATETSFVRSGK
ncbi:MAG TPA: hypothetical protein VGI24_07325 [Solirubrobacteraceae bacterium]|jgi:hypothetical protein